MPKLEDDQEARFASRRRPGRFYVSRRFGFGGEELSEGARPARFAFQVFDSSGDVIFENEDGWELVLRETSTRQQVKALFFEDSRRIEHLAFQRFDAGGKRIHRDYFVLHGDEIVDLGAFLSLILAPSVELVEGEEGTRLSRSIVARLLEDQTTHRELYERNKKELLELLQTDVSAPEVVAIARRRRQLEVFEELLRNADYFDLRREEVTGTSAGSPERVWQDFFENNRWIFGSGLAPQFLHGWSNASLQQSVVGASVKRGGKRPDALMRTAGALSAMVFVEIKTHTTPLLSSRESRPDTWAPSQELMQGIAQCQATIDAAVEELGPEVPLRDAAGFDSGDWAALCRPRSLLVAGTLEEFLQSGHPHKAKFRAFERFRRSLRDPEVVTFDELYERARLVHDLRLS